TVFWASPQPDGGDIAVLELVSAVPASVQPLHLVTADNLSGHRFRAYGFPNDVGGWAYGFLRDEVATTGWVQIEGDSAQGYRVEPGFSGTPVWDDDLDGVAGIAVAAERQVALKVAFIIPSKVLIAAYPELGKQAIPQCPYRGLSAFREEDSG